jgi:hypothetical protein
MAMIALLLARRNRKLFARTLEEAILKWLGTTTRTSRVAPSALG